MEKQYSYPAEYLKLGRYLWERINLSDPKEYEVADSLCKIVDELRPLYEEYQDEEEYDGLMFYLSEWAADRRDTGDSWQQYGDSIKADYPEFFAPPETTAEHPAIPAAGPES